jgi:membrane fusion protein, multidrug efflux system
MSEHGENDKKRAPIALYIGGVIAVLVVGGAVAGVALTRKAEAEKETKSRGDELDKGPRVRTTKAALSEAGRKLELQGEARPFFSVTLYAKVSGYLKQIRVDKGDKVKANQVVAVIESPELDRQYDAAVADAQYKRSNARRAEALSKPGVVSAQEAESQIGLAQVSEATVQSLAQQKSYETLRAPFAGTVTARFADPGALVQNAANAQTGALPVVTISQTDTLRVYVYVDQHDATFVHVGDKVELWLPDRPDQKVQARVARRADELDPRTRTMLVEVDVDNRENKIVPGSFVTVGLAIAAPRVVQVPVEALVVRSGGKSFVPVVQGDTVRYRPVVIIDDDGSTARLADGIKAGETVALNLGENVPDGARVQPVTPNDESHDGKAQK